MAKYVTMGAVLKCSYGMSTSTLLVINPLRPFIQNKLVAATTDFVPLVNILTFGMCQSTSNPTVSAATSAAMGTLTPMPCVPVVTAAWSPGSQSKIGGIKALLDSDKTTCSWGGSITIENPGHTDNHEAK